MAYFDLASQGHKTISNFKVKMQATGDQTALEKSYQS